MKSSYADFFAEIINHYQELKIAFSFQDWGTDFLRFFNSEVNYNITKDNLNLKAQIYKGKRSYSFQMDSPTEQDIIQTIDNAILLIDKLPEDPDFVDLEDNMETVAEIPKENNIEKVSLARKINILKQISDAVKPYDYNIYGTFICNYCTQYIINSNGVNKTMVNSPIMLELKAMSQKNDVTVISSFGGEDINDFNLENFIGELIEKIKIARNDIIDVQPDNYEVILAPSSIGQLVAYLVFVGMNAISYDKRQSYFENKIGDKVFSDIITIMDDPSFPGLISTDYNSDGHIYKKNVLVKNGTFKKFLVNNYYSYKTGMVKNGGEGQCLVLDKGNTTLNSMIKGIKKGLYISNLHYMNFINPKETSVTGLTRDGTFLIEDGKMTKVVNNLRYTVKLVDILKNITALENVCHIIPNSGNYGAFSIKSAAMPHVKVSSFKITSSTETI